MRVRFDRFYTYADLGETLEAWAEEHPSRFGYESIGRSYEGREIWLCTVTNTETGPPEEKPAVFVHAQIHAMEFTGTTAALNLQVTTPLIAVDLLHGGPEAYGFLAAAAGAGSLLSALNLALGGPTTLGRILLGAAAIGLATIALAFVYVIAVWAFLTGCLTIVAAIQLRKVIADEWLLGLSGAGTLLFGVSLAVYPEAGMSMLLTLIGAYAIIAGILHIALGFRLRHLHTATQQTVAGTQSPTL